MGIAGSSYEPEVWRYKGERLSSSGFSAVGETAFRAGAQAAAGPFEGVQ